MRSDSKQEGAHLGAQLPGDGQAGGDADHCRAGRAPSTEPTTARGNPPIARRILSRVRVSPCTRYAVQTDRGHRQSEHPEQGHRASAGAVRLWWLEDERLSDDLQLLPDPDLAGVEVDVTLMMASAVEA